MTGYEFAIVVVALVVIVALHSNNSDNSQAVKDLLAVLGHLFGKK